MNAILEAQENSHPGILASSINYFLATYVAAFISQTIFASQNFMGVLLFIDSSLELFIKRDSGKSH